jgi:flagellar basal-body rod protein FlgB
MFETLDVFRISSAMAKHAGQKQALAAQNVANADTPGYAARDIPDFKTLYLSESAAGTQRATRAKHLNGLAGAVGMAAPIDVKKGATPNGNQVSLEQEMLKSVDAKRQHDRALAIYKHAMTVLRSASRSK